jgi:TonB family protein
VWGGLTGTEIGEAYGVGGLGLVGTGRGGDPVHTARAGAPIHWEDGTVAGQVLAARDFTGPARDVAGRRCFDVKLVSGEDAALSLCFDAADLEEKSRPAAGVGSLGTIGLIGRGSGSGYGTGGGGFGGRGKRVPAVRHAKAEVKGSLDKDIIRRIVRAHINEVRYCYNKLLVKEPTAEGKVTVSFTIDATGKVSASSVADNTTGNDDVAECIAKAVKRWTFPRPTGGGVVTVSYPFVLSPGA